MSKIRVLIADDHALMREGVKALLAGTDDIQVVGEAEDGDDAIKEVRRLDPDVVLMDVAMPGLGGLEATLAIRKEKPEVKILVLTQYDDREYSTRAGWGHSTVRRAIEFAALAGAGRLVLFHHDPGHDDATLESLVTEAVARERPSFPVAAAMEGTSVEVARRA